MIALRLNRKHFKLFAAACIFLMAMVPGSSLANVTVTAPSLTVYACGGTFPTAYRTLGNIVITEGANGDFAGGSNLTLILTAPANFEFNAGVGSVFLLPVIISP